MLSIRMIAIHLQLRPGHLQAGQRQPLPPRAERGRARSPRPGLRRGGHGVARPGEARRLSEPRRPRRRASLLAGALRRKLAAGPRRRATKASFTKTWSSTFSPPATCRLSSPWLTSPGRRLPPWPPTRPSPRTWRITSTCRGSTRGRSRPASPTLPAATTPPTSGRSSSRSAARSTRPSPTSWAARCPRRGTPLAKIVVADGLSIPERPSRPGVTRL